MTQEIPDKLGKYDVKDEIARGSMGVVYLGHDPFIDQPVALKLALAEPLSDFKSGERYRKMFFNEAHTAGSLTHPNIIRILDAGVDEEICYIVMEYVEGGGTLKEVTSTESLLSIKKVVEIIFKCSKALDYAHREGVIHRDIKPSNILYTYDEDVKIADFSIAQFTQQDVTSTQVMGIIGSPRYMSPEQLREDNVGNQTDLYSLGVVMYELLTGKHPFAADNFSRLVNKVLTEETTPIQNYRSDIPPELATIVHKALERDVNNRYQMGLEIACDLSLLFESLEKPLIDITSEEHFNKIKSLDFFQGFPDSEVWEIIRASAWQDYKADEDIIIEGDMDDSFYIIIDGFVEVKKNTKTIRSLRQGDCFGEMGYLAKTRRTATIKAGEATSLLKVNSTVISQVSIDCQVRFLKVFLRTLIYRLSDTTEKIYQDD